MPRRRKLVKPAETPAADPKVIYEETPTTGEVIEAFKKLDLRGRWMVLLAVRKLPMMKTERPMMPKLCRVKAPPLKKVADTRALKRRLDDLLVRCPRKGNSR